MDYFPRKSLSKYLITETIDFNKHVHDIDNMILDNYEIENPREVREINSE